MTNRWSFNNANSAAPGGSVIADTVSGQNAVVVGNGATFASGALTLPGTTTGNQTPAAISAYVDLPNGLISSKTNFTLEIWATPVAAKNWQRLFDFGRMDLTGNPAAQGAGAAPGEVLSTATASPGNTVSSDDVTLAINRDTTANTQRLVGRINGATELTSDTNLTLSPGTQYHFVIIYTEGAGIFSSSGGQLAWYRDGILATTTDVNFRLSSVEDVNNWLGRSQYSIFDSTANVTYNEVRLYNHAMSSAEISASYLAGPNPAFPPPVAANDSISMHRGQKARIDVLANDTGTLSPTTVTVLQNPQFGTAAPDSTGKILYTHTVGNPTADSFTYRVGGPGGVSAATTVTISFATGLRVENPGLSMPANPPPVAIQAINAFPGLSFTGPTCLATPPGDTQRLFVCTKGGTLSVIPSVTATTPTSSILLTLSATSGGLFSGRIPAESLSTSSEQGLLGLAFHPNFASNGYFFIFYSVLRSGLRYERVSRLTLNNPTSATPTVNLASELILLQQLDEYTNHNGGDLHFGPDGYLYISLGDEGNQNDQGFNSQLIDKDFFSGLLRIDVNLEGDEITGGNPEDPDDANIPPNTHPSIPLYGGKPAYEVPADNPFVGATTFNGLAVAPSAVRSEFWAVGLRNPWRFSFDGSELWCGDVGGNLREEVNVIARGGNYGWVYREGTTTGPYLASSPPHAAPPAGFTSLDPLYEYSHGSGPTQGDSITGGFVYRGTRLPGLTGAYIFADHLSGNVWSLTRNGANPPTVTRILGEAGIAAFAPDPSNGDVLMADYTGNRLLRIAAVTDTTSFPATLSATNLFADLTDLSPSPGLLPYSVNLPFWSDYADKRRWFIVPGAGSLAWSRDGVWTFPTGQIWVKHFDLELTRPNPSTKKRIETRLLVKNAGGSYGVSYRWNDAGTEATLVSDSGDDFDVNLTVNGSPYTQRWSIPSRAQCLTCHTPQAGHALSFNTRQLNLSNTINGFSGNQLDLLESGPYFSNSAESPNLLPFHLAPDDANFPAEARVRSYLAVNCAYCHQPGGTAAPAAWDGRPEVSLAQTGLIDGEATNNGGNALNKLVVSGSLTHSIVYNRVALPANNFTRMPPLGSNELDPKAITLLTEWITQALPAKKTYAQWRLEKFGSAASPNGDPAADPDGDGRTNQKEYLAATNPLSGSSFFTATPSWSGGQFQLNFLAPVNQSIQVETSPDLFNWTLWDVPGNQGTPRLGGPASLSGPAAAGSKFFRLQLRDN